MAHTQFMINDLLRTTYCFSLSLSLFIHSFKLDLLATCVKRLPMHFMQNCKYTWHTTVNTISFWYDCVCRLVFYTLILHGENGIMEWKRRKDNKKREKVKKYLLLLVVVANLKSRHNRIMKWHRQYQHTIHKHKPTRNWWCESVIVHDWEEQKKKSMCSKRSFIYSLIPSLLDW